MSAATLLPPIPRICVVGSMNVDYFMRVERLPGPGETVVAREFTERFGGKGANQAIAAARQGAHVAMIGCVGHDDMGAAYLSRLNEEGIEIGGIRQVEGLTGSAFISVDAAGENTIVVAAGANAQVTAADVDAARDAIVTADVVMVQLETTLEAVREACRLAHEFGKRVILNPSPWRDDLPWAELKPEFLILNAGEAARLGSAAHGTRLVTQGAKPTQVIAKERSFEVAAFPVEPVDTVGAGDAFAGAFATWLARGDSVELAVRKANAAAALTTLEIGAQEAMPGYAETLAFLEKRG